MASPRCSAHQRVLLPIELRQGIGEAKQKLMFVDVHLGKLLECYFQQEITSMALGDWQTGAMARRGVWHLEKLCLFYCDISGSSRGAREFLAHSFPKLKDDNPWLTVDTEMRRSRHPFFMVRYRNGNRRLVDLKNKNLKEIEEQMYYLKNSVGRRTCNPTVRHTSKRPSIQGMWTPLTFVPQDVPIAAFDKMSMDVRLNPPDEPQIIAPNYVAHETNQKTKKSKKERALERQSKEGGNTLVSRWAGQQNHAQQETPGAV